MTNCVLLLSGLLVAGCAPLAVQAPSPILPAQASAAQQRVEKLDSPTPEGSTSSSTAANAEILTPDINSFDVVAQQRGQASWYGGRFHGRKTASGERFDMHGDTAAHRTWPLGTWVRVTNLRNQRSVILRINDRGPFHSQRILDVSKSAAHRLDFHHHGSAPILLERLRSKPVAPGGASAAAGAAPAEARN